MAGIGQSKGLDAGSGDGVQGNARGSFLKLFKNLYLKNAIFIIFLRHKNSRIIFIQFLIILIGAQLRQSLWTLDQRAAIGLQL